LASVSLCVLGLSGCKGLRRISECQRFVSLANSALSDIEVLDEPEVPEPHEGNYAKIAGRFLLLKQQITDLGLRDLELSQAAAGFQATAEQSAGISSRYAEQLRVLAASTDNNKGESDAKRALAATRSEMERVRNTHEATRSRVDAVCKPR
jgi:hypothetical protein